MKFTNLSKLLIKFIGGGLVNFPTRYLKEVELEAEGGESDGEGGEAMDFKTYCDTIIRNLLIDSNIPIEDVVMPDAYIQVSQDNEGFTIDGDYLKPHLLIIALYNDTLVIDESKTYIGSGQSIINPVLISGDEAKKDTSIPIENYCVIIARGA